MLTERFNYNMITTKEMRNEVPVKGTKGGAVIKFQLQKLPKEIVVAEVGPRDGFQIEKEKLSVAEKVEFIERAVESGARIIEIGSFVHPKAIPTLADTDEVAKRIKRVEGVEYRALGMNLKSIERAKESGVNKLKLTVSASVEHSLANLNKTPDKAIEGFDEVANFASKNNIELSGAISTSFGCSIQGYVPFEDVIKTIDAFIKVGVTELSLSDTTGMANPKQVYEYSRYVIEHYPDIVWNLHFHNTRGMGLANVYAGLLAGINRFDACFGGLGGCPFAPGASGNVATEDILNMANEMGLENTYDIDKVIRLAREVVERFNKKEIFSHILKAGKNSDIIKK